MSIRNYRELVVWQKAIDFTVAVYEKTKHFPRDEIYGLTSQLRRAVVSIPSNIAEGQGRRTTIDFERFLNIAQGSLNEVETQIIVGQRLGYVSSEDMKLLLSNANEIGRLLGGLRNSLAKKRTPAEPVRPR